MKERRKVKEKKKKQFLFNTFPHKAKRQKKKKKKIGWLAGVINLNRSKITADMQYFLELHSSRIPLKIL
jgi:hypothetical protein